MVRNVCVNWWYVSEMTKVQNDITRSVEVRRSEALSTLLNTCSEIRQISPEGTLWTLSGQRALWRHGPRRAYNSGKNKSVYHHHPPPAPPPLGAGAMTTKFLDNKICTFKFLLSWRFPQKNVLGRFSSMPPTPPPPSKAKILFLLSSRRLRTTL